MGKLNYDLIRFLQGKGSDILFILECKGGIRTSELGRLTKMNKKSGDGLGLFSYYLTAAKELDLIKSEESIEYSATRNYLTDKGRGVVKIIRGFEKDVDELEGIKL